MYPFLILDPGDTKDAKKKLKAEFWRKISEINFQVATRRKWI